MLIVFRDEVVGAVMFDKGGEYLEDPGIEFVLLVFGMGDDIRHAFFAEIELVEAQTQAVVVDIGILDIGPAALYVDVGAQDRLLLVRGCALHQGVRYHKDHLQGLPVLRFLKVGFLALDSDCVHEPRRPHVFVVQLQLI